MLALKTGGRFLFPATQKTREVISHFSYDMHEESTQEKWFYVKTWCENDESAMQLKKRIKLK